MGIFFLLLFWKQEFWDFQVFFRDAAANETRLCIVLEIYTLSVFRDFWESHSQMTIWTNYSEPQNCKIPGLICVCSSAIADVAHLTIIANQLRRSSFPLEQRLKFPQTLLLKLQVQFCHGSRGEKSWQDGKEEEGTIFPHGKLAVTSCLWGRAAFWVESKSSWYSFEKFPIWTAWGETAARRSCSKGQSCNQFVIDAIWKDFEWKYVNKVAGIS